VAEAEVARLQARQAPDGRRAPVVTDDGPGLLSGLSARNRLAGFVDEVRIDGLLAQVRLRVGNQGLTAVITADAVRALKLRRGDDAIAIVKSTEVMIGTPAPAAGRSRKRARK
jgi:molybdopterin-binding protein